MPISTNALDATDTLFLQTASMDEIRVIAESAPKFFPETSDWENVSITKETPLYDIDGGLLSYCMDLQNADTGLNAYVIISTNKAEYPIVQFAPEATSPYYSNLRGKALFLGVGSYAVDSGTAVTDLATGETIQNIERSNNAGTSVSVTESEMTEEVSEVWSMYAEGVAPQKFFRRGKNIYYGERLQ